MDGKTEDNNINLGKFLPLGAVVLLKNATKRVMITGFCSIRKDDPNDKKIYDYIGCAFPEGIMSTDQNLLFLDTNMDAGHGGASGRFEALKEVAKEFSFLLDLEKIKI